MPTLPSSFITVADFVQETRDDYNSPITSTFVSKMQQCRNTITTLEEVSTKLIINILSILQVVL